MEAEPVRCSQLCSLETLFPGAAVLFGLCLKSLGEEPHTNGPSGSCLLSFLTFHVCILSVGLHRPSWLPKSKAMARSLEQQLTRVFTPHSM